VLSNHKGYGTRAFTSTVRSTFTDDVRKSVKDLPGPGNYENKTEFGRYGDAKYYKKNNQ